MSGLSPSLSFPHPVFELFPCARPCIISSSSMQGKPFLFSPKVPQNNQLGLVEVSAFTKLSPFRRYSLEILAHSFRLLHLVKLLRLLPNHRSHPRPKFTRLPLLWHVDTAPSFPFQKSRGSRRMLAGVVWRRLGAFDRSCVWLKALSVGCSRLSKPLLLAKKKEGDSLGRS